VQLKEKEFNQRSLSLWFTGLSGAGKTSIATHLEKKLRDEHDLPVKVLDGDSVRLGINKDLGFSNEDRFENIRRTAEIAKLFAETNTVNIISLITPNEDMREMAKEIIGENFKLIFIDTSLEVCEKRDVKGLYKKARNLEIDDFTGITSDFEIPKNYDLRICTDQKTIQACTEEIISKFF
jgi:adenylylsulfate kinase